MKTVGLTGGIGSGKSTVAKMFQDLGIPLYIADDRAKILMNSSAVIKSKLIGLFGTEAYHNDLLNRPFLADKIFKNADLLKEMNAIVHPEVGMDFIEWRRQQNAPYVIKEAAIIFENNLQSQYDYIITVIADVQLRIDRVIQRDHTTREKIMAIVKNQWTDAEKMEHSDFIITNHEIADTKDQVLRIHQRLSELVAEN